MSNASLQRVMRHIRQLAGRRAPQSRGSPGYARQRPEAPESDRDLLTRYLNEQDHDAFAALMRRHGPMVRGVCQRLLDQEADRDDAFQATFLVLLHKAPSIRKRHSVGSWLYGVAYRIALKARAKARRMADSGEPGCVSARSLADTTFNSDPSRIAAWRELCALLDEELHRLSDRYRSPLVLCYLAGHTQEEAANHLGWSLRTLKRRVERGKELLRLRLSRRGLTLSSTLLIAGLSQQEAAAVVPVALTLETIKEAGLVAAAKGASTTISANTLALTKAALKSLALGKLKCALVCVLMAVVAAAGAGLAVQHMLADKPVLAKLDEAAQQQQVRTAAPSSAKEEKPTRTDRYGDPLPEGALQRLGTVRFRVPFQNSVAFCANGKTFVSALNSAVLMFDGTTGKIIRKFPAEGTVHSVAISPDGKMIAGGDHSGIRIWSAASGLETRQFQARDAYPRTLLFRPDGKALAAANVNAPFQLWDLTSGKELWNRIFDDKASLDPLAFSADGSALVVLEHGSHAIIFLDAATGQERRRFDGPEKGDLVISPNLQKVAVVGADWAIHLWDLTTGREIRQLPRVHQMPQRFTFSPNGKILAWARDEKSGRGFSLIDVVTGKEVRRIAKNLEFPNVLTFWPNEKTLAFCTWHERTVRFWDIERDREIHSPEGHRGGISSIVYSRDGENLTSAGMDGTVRQWDVASGKELQQFAAHQGGLWGMALAPDSKTIATASLNDKIIRLWDSATGKEIRRLEGYQDGVHSLAFSPDGHILASGGCRNLKEDRLLRFWDVSTGKEIRFAVDPNPVSPDARPEAYGILSVSPVKFSPDGKFLAAVCGTNIGILEVATGRRFADFVVSKSIMDIKDIAFSPDGRSLACGGQGSLDGKYSIHLWELASGKERLPIKAVGAKTSSVAFSPDGKFLAVGGTDKKIGVADTVWMLDARNGEVIRKFDGHQSWMTALAFARDGKQLASGAQDTTILIWNVADLPSTDRSQSLKLSTGDLDEVWADLASDDAEKAYRGIWKLVAFPQQAVPLLSKRLKPAVSIDSERVSGLIAELDSSSFIAREKAFEELSRLEDLAEPALRTKLAGKPSLETRRRIETLLGKLQGPVTSAEMLRSLRGVEVLEHIGTSEAKKLLDDLAGGAVKARLTQEAKGALLRLQTKEPRTK